MKNYEEMNAPEKIIYNAIENYIPINEVVKTLCDLFIEIDEKEKDLYNSKMDKFLKLNFLTETSFEKKHKELLLFNHFSLINAISTTFNTDINLTHYLKYDFTDYIEFQREILSIKKNKYLTINEILNIFYKCFNINCYEDLIIILNNNDFNEIFNKVEKQFEYFFKKVLKNEYGNKYLHDKDLCFYLYKIGFIIFKTNIINHYNEENVESNLIYFKRLILHPDKI